MKKIFFCLLITLSTASAQVPDGFVDLKKFIPSIVLDVRYATAHNFTGVPVDGYNAPKCYLTRKAAKALKNVQAELLEFGLSLKVYDAYRPQHAVNHFVRWAKVLNDTLTKGEFYPAVDKSRLFKEGYIASKSSHSRGSTVDLTIVPLPLPDQEEYIPGDKLCDCVQPADFRFNDNSIDMGTGFDCFHINSSTESKNIGAEQRAHRMLLKTVMRKHGFINYDREWWHYTLRNEPYPNRYFDFVIE